MVKSLNFGGWLNLIFNSPMNILSVKMEIISEIFFYQEFLKDFFLEFLLRMIVRCNIMITAVGSYRVVV